MSNKFVKTTAKTEAVAKAKEFLEGLPNRPNRQSDVIKAVKSIRKKHGYQ